MARKKREETPIKDALLLNAVTPALNVKRLYLEADEDLCRVLSFTSFKKEVDVGWADCLFQQPNMPVCIRLEPTNGALLLDSIDQTQNQLHGKLNSNNRLRASQRNQYERELRHGEEILDMVGDEGAKFFDVSLIAVMRARDKDTLDRECDYFSTVCGSYGMKFMAIPDDQLEGWFAASPLRTPDRDMYERTAHPMPSTTIGYLNPAVSPGLDDGVGITIGVDKNNGPVRLNITETNDNRLNCNVVIFAESGSGKTILAQMLLEREYVQFGSKIIVIDPEGEFRQEVLRLGGEVIKMGAASAAKLSPLQPRAIIFNEEEGIDTESDDTATSELVLLSTIPFVKSWFRRALSISEEYMDAFEVALERAYGRYGITKHTTFGEYLEKNMSYPIMTDIYEVLEELCDTDPDRREAYINLCGKVRPFATGIYSSLWNKRTSIGLESDIVCIDTSDMQSDETMMRAQYYNVLSWVWSEIRLNPKSDRNIRIIIDEASIVVNKETVEAAEMTRNMVKRIRKRNGGTTIITQEPNDFLHEQVRMQGAAICNNATYVFLGYAKAENLVQTAKIYKLDLELQKKLERARRGEFAVLAGTSDRTWVKVECADWEFELFGKKRAK